MADITTPILRNEPASPEAINGLGPLAALIGSWHNAGGSDDQYIGFNVMPLPQASVENINDYILFNFPYFELMTFETLGPVPNRGGTFKQTGYSLLYEQRVFFGNGPKKDQGVHVENGIYLKLIHEPQTLEPYGNTPMSTPPAPNPIPPQDPLSNIAKQVSVPHGNSILVTGTYTENSGAPQIPNVNTIPTDSEGNFIPNYEAKYGKNNPGNIVVNPNLAIQNALTLAIKNNGNVKKHTEIKVSSKNKHGTISNIKFEQKRAKVTEYETTLWISEFENGKSFLQYSQNIILQFGENNPYTFYHIDSNSMTKTS